MTQDISLISPYKGHLVELVAPEEERARLFGYTSKLNSIQITQREVCDLELLAIGAFSPLRTFMSASDFAGVVDEMRLSDGTLFPLPVTLSTNEISNFRIGQDVALRDQRNEILGILKVEDIYEWDRARTAKKVFGTNDLRHPVAAEMQTWGRFNLSGELKVLKLPEYHDFRELRLSPLETRTKLAALGRSNTVAFQTRNPIHRAHEAMMQLAIETVDGTLLLHPVVGMTQSGDIDNFTRVRIYKAFAESTFKNGRLLLALLPLAMRMAGPREAVLHAIIRRNYGANHLIVGRDHASPGNDSSGQPFYEPLAAQELAHQFSSETGVKVIPFQELVYLPDERRYEQAGKVGPGRKSFAVSATRIRENLVERGKKVPEWLMRKEIADILAKSFPSRERPGICLWFTGLSGAGKSTTAEIVTSLLLAEGRRSTVLDGDVVRTNLSKGLGFSREDRDTNIKRIGFVASEVVRHGGVAVCAAVSPYRESRNEVRSMFNTGQFVEIFVDAPLDVCEKRDPKGMYAKARRGELEHFTGVGDVYECPTAAEITLDTIGRTADENARIITDYLRAAGFLSEKAIGADNSR